MTFTLETSALQLGIFMGAASIVSIGPNNLMLIREGLVRGRVGLVASLVLASEIALIIASFLMASSLGHLGSGLRTLLSWAGLAAICWFAWQSLRAGAASRGAGHILAAENGRACLLRVMGVVWLNPLAYVELLLVPAAISQSFATTPERLQFTAALIVMDALGCYGFAFGGRIISGVLRHGQSVRIFDVASGVILSVLALTMASGLLSRSW